jgi:hypothetical protein
MKMLLGESTTKDHRENSNKLSDIKVCAVWGNQRLAFVNTAVVLEGDRELGQRTNLIVLIRSGATWEVKVVSRDVGIISKLAEELPTLSSESPGGRLQVPVLKNPPDRARVPRRPPPELEWVNAGADTAVYLIESQFQWDRANWSGSAFELTLPPGAERTIRMAAPFGVGMQPHRWRIWAIDKAGNVQIGEWRIIDFTN